MTISRIASDDILQGLRPGRARISRAPCQKMIEATFAGHAAQASEAVIGLLYATLRAIRRERREQPAEFPMGRLRARWCDARVPAQESAGPRALGLPVPDDVDALPPVRRQAQACGVTVGLSTWEYGIIGWLLHTGGRDTKAAAIDALKRHIREQGYGIIPDSYEEIYLSHLRRTPEHRRKALLLFRLARFY